MFTKDDLARYEAFKRIIKSNDLKMEISFEATKMASNLLRWFEELGPKIESAINEEKPKGKK